MPKIRQKLAELETLEGGGAGGMGGGGGGGRRLTMDERVAENTKNAGDMKKNMAGLAGYMAGPVVGGVGAIVGGKVLGDIKAAQREKAEREAAAEMQRETRGVEKTSTDRAREAAAEMKLQERTNKAYEDASKNMKKGGKVSSASSRADGICVKGKTRGKMV
jgi:hypothetical protein